jgi:hypothetical protein
MAIEIDKVSATLTSDASGDATETTDNVIGILRKIVLTPVDGNVSANWDFSVRGPSEHGGSIYETVFADITVASNTVTVFYPVATASATTDGSDSTLLQVHPLLYGPQTFVGANMGATQTAYVDLYIQKM